MTWPTCIVTMIDMADIGKLIAKRDSKASELMRRFHKVVRDYVHLDANYHKRVYCWNDSVLLHANIDDEFIQTPRLIMQEAEDLKRKIDTLRPCYAVSVMGQAFPAPKDANEAPPEGSKSDTEFIYISASSYAFANCDAILKELEAERADWYVDGRIVAKVPELGESTESAMVEMVPKRKKRRVWMYKGCLPFAEDAPQKAARLWGQVLQINNSF